jgi:hypothetical protein
MRAPIDVRIRMRARATINGMNKHMRVVSAVTCSAANAQPMHTDET